MDSTITTGIPDQNKQNNACLIHENGGPFVSRREKEDRHFYAAASMHKSESSSTRITGYFVSAIPIF